MAYQTIGTYNIYDFEQEEIIETNQVAGENGVVTEVSTIIQQYVHIRFDLEVQQEIISEENKSNFLAKLYWSATNGENGNDITIDVRNNSYNTGTSIYLGDYYTFNGQISLNNYRVSVPLGETVTKQLVCIFDSSSTYNRNYTQRKILTPYHNLDGTFSNFSDSVGNIINPRFVVKAHYGILNFIKDGEAQNIFWNTGSSGKVNVDFTPLTIDRAIYPLTADNFTDEGNPSFSYTAISGTSYIGNGSYATDSIVSLQSAISLDGETIDIDYRNISTNSGTYTFTLTEAEREILREHAQGSPNVPIYYLIKVIRGVNNQSVTFVSSTERIFTVVGANPSLNPTVKDIKSETLALTGNENTFIRYESMAEYAINATASKHATIVSQSVTCGSKTISNLPNGVIDDVESAAFIFQAYDSRGLQTQTVVQKNLVEYVKPTCYQKLEIQISGETGAQISLTVNGNYYDGSFGAVNNTLQLQVRFTDDSGVMGSWTNISGTPTYTNNKYELTTTFSGFNYGKSYIFQCKAIDKLNTVESSQYTIRLLPVFDWSDTDFNFNVPVNIEANELDMHGNTVLTHNDTSNTTVLSASGGNVYIRPNGPTSTYGETIIYSNGNVAFNGNVDINGNIDFDSFSISGNTIADYIIASGSSSMGSNGTWYWYKYASGKSEAWGCRNFGKCAITTSYGSLYRSEVFSQDLPSNVFIRTPDVININVVSASMGCWVSKHETAAPSAATTGSFIVLRPASATTTMTYIGFHIIGEWK